MKKFILIAIASLLALSISAQNKVGIIAGANFSSLKLDDGSSVSDKFKTRTGFTAGLSLDYKLIAGLGINTGLVFNQRNVEDQSSTTGNEKLTTNSLELPLNLTFGINLPVIRPFVMAGPYLDCGLSAKRGDDKLEYGSDKDLERFNYGVNMGAGIDLFSFLRIMYQYDLGLSSLNTGVNDALNTDVKNRGHRVSVGIMF